MAGNSTIFLLIYLYINVTSIVSAFFLTKTIRAIWKNERQERMKFSLILKYYFWMLLIMSILLLIHTTTVLVIWRDDLKFPLAPFFWSGNFDSAFMTAIPFTTFTLTFDKCLILILKEKYRLLWTKLLFYVSIVVNVIVATASFVIYVLFRRPELPEGCVATGCLVAQPALVVYGDIKTVGVVVNTSAGIAFLIIIARLKKTKPQIGTKVRAIAEAIVLRAVIFGIFFDFIPHIINSVWNTLDQNNPLRYIGPFIRIIMATDLLLNAIMNWLVFRKKNSKVSTTPFNVDTTTVGIN